MHQFFVRPEQISENRIIITGEDVNHIKNVLRMKVGDEIAVSNGIDGKEYRCGILAMKDEIVCELRFIKEDGVELPCKVTLFQGLPKADKMELIIQKTVELGVSEIVPVSMGRCVVKLDAKKQQAKLQRFRGIAESAAKQSKRRIIPEIKEVMTMKEACQYASTMDVVLVPYELAGDMQATKQIISSIQAGQSVGFFIGPEGGFEEKEIAMAMASGAKIITLGKRILRTETAGLTVMSILMYHLEA